MLYSIIPPILLVLSVIGIIVFFIKKAPAAEKLGTELEENGKAAAVELSDGTVVVVEKDHGKPSAIKQIWLAVLEGIIGMLRKFFLNSERSFGKMIKKIREKKGMRLEKRNDEIKKKDNDIIEKLNRYEARENSSPEERQKAGVMEMKKESSEEASMKPMLSDRVAVPNSGMRKKKEQEIKEHLENLLIERIAMNPRDTEAYERLGEYYFEMENYEHAKDCFKQVVKLDPTNRSVKYKMKKLEVLLSR
ncbi:MAG: tetratricopeptide repeat protein [Candidatus Moranbacteria bacterium]|nr:tetratricopeptide repeat protein [Candidatus Moranbacteria bacterium]